MSTLSKQMVIAPQEIFVSSTTQGTDLGQLATTGDGRFFRYVKAGAVNLIAGNVVQSPAWDVVNQAPAGGLAVGQAVATGAAGFTISTSTTLAVNLLAGSMMSVAVAPGAGFAYKVKSNSVTAGATGCAIVLEDPLQTNLSTASRVVFSVNPYSGVIQLPIAVSGEPVGVAVSNLASGTYGWIQTRGLASVLIGGTAAVGSNVGVNVLNATAGSLQVPTGVQWPSYGVLVATANYGEFNLVDLRWD